MSIKERIQKDRLEAMKSKDMFGKNVLSTLLGELDRIGKNPSDEEIGRLVKKMMESNMLTNTTNENEYLSKYLPSMMSEDDIKMAIEPYIEANGLNNPKSMGLVMKFLKDNYNGQYDGALASKVVREVLNS